MYYGSATGLSTTAAWTKESNQEGARFGSVVSTAGDVNGDGYSDVIVGAPYYDRGQVDEGRVFVYYGAAAGLNTGPAWMPDSNQAGAQFGASVATAGDVNGDGYSDIIVGAPLYGNGRACVYFGSAAGPSAAPDWTAEGSSADGEFGSAVSTAGDVNGDGYSDILVGEFGYSNGQAYEGRAVAYYGNGSAGLSPRAQQRRSTNAAPIGCLNASDRIDGFRLAALARTPFGRGDVKLQWEVEPRGALFNGAGLQQSAAWTDTGAAGAEISELVTGLSGNEVYHWRLRFVYRATTTPHQPHGRWISAHSNGWQEADLRTGIADSDGDSVTDVFDNCPTVANTGQEDSDGDSFGDVCDNCPLTSNPGQEDCNANGVGDACEPYSLGPFMGPYALSFDGTNDYVRIADTPEFPFTTQMTLEAWIQPRSTAGVQSVVQHGQIGAPEEADLLLGIIDGEYTITSLIPTPPYVIAAAADIPAGDVGSWVHLAGSFDGTRWHLYRNGQLLASSATGTISPIPLGSRWSIGANSTGSTHFFNGRIDEVRFWSVGRTAQQIQDNYRAVLPPANEPDLQGYWRFSEGTGATAFDNAGTATNGSLLPAAPNGPTWMAVGVDANGNLVPDSCEPPVITGQPASRTLCKPGPVSFAVTTSEPGAAGLKYRWRKGTTQINDGGKFSGATTPTLTINPADANDAAGNYNCLVTNAHGSTPSNNAALAFATPVTADFDSDCDVDMDDAAAFAACVSGPTVPPATGCQTKDLDGDTDVDQADFGVFQRCFSGANIPAAPGCDQ